MARLSNRPPVIEVVDDAVADMLRQKTGPQKIALVAQGWRQAREMILSQVRSENPVWTERQVNSEVSRRMANGST